MLPLPDRTEGSPPQDRGADAVPVHAARDLTAGGAKACILLDGAAYELRITRAGKLILTK